MTFEIFIYRAHMFSVKLQAYMQQPPSFWKPFAASLGVLIQQTLMGICYARVLAEGEKQWRIQKSAKSATKK